MNLLDTSGAHHPPTQPGVKALPHHRASIRPGLAEQLLVRKLKVKLAFEEMKSGEKLARTEGRFCYQCPGGLQFLAVLVTAGRYNLPVHVVVYTVHLRSLPTLCQTS